MKSTGLYKYLFVLITFLLQGQLSGKEVITFNYGGAKGKKHGGQVTVDYKIVSLKKSTAFDKSEKIIDLNLYRENVSLVVKFSDLKLGLNKSADKTRHSEHKKVFYLEVQADLSHKNAIEKTNSPIKVASTNSHYGLNESELQYVINPHLQFGKTITLKTTLIIVDGVYNRKWPVKTLAETVIIRHRIDPCKTVVCKNNQYCVEGKCVTQPLSGAKNPCLKCKTNEYCVGTRCIPKKGQNHRSSNSGSSANCENCETFEVCINNRCQKTEAFKLWERVEMAYQSNDEQTLEKCKLYLSNCDAGIFDDCFHYEDVLCIEMELVEEEKQIELENLYLENYPEGKCKDSILVRIKNRIPPYDSIKNNFATLNYDDRALIVNKVVGGLKPYYIDFFDFKENEDFPIKRERFSKEFFCLDLNTLNIPTGEYHVKVVDNKGNPFTDQEEIYIYASAESSKSAVALLFTLFFVMLFGLYRKYIQF